MSIKKRDFGKTADGQAVSLYELTNSHGLKAKITNYGGIIVSLEVPDRQGDFADIVHPCCQPQLFDFIFMEMDVL